MTSRALVVGGTGPTGPHIVQGLLDRGYETTIFHRGTHESEDVPDVEHIHGDPHFAETISEALRDRDFELVVGLYGRLRFLAEVIAGRCERFISVGGAPGVRGQMEPGKVTPFGLKGVLSEDDPTVGDEGESRAGYKIALTERIILDLHGRGRFAATHLRYPQIYGPRQITPREWSVVKRVRDGRATMIVPDNGLVIRSRASARNAAHSVLLAVDHPERAAGEIFNCAEDDQFTVRQWNEMTARCAGGSLEMVSLPGEVAAPFHSIPRSRNHMLLDTHKIRERLGYRDVVSAEDGLQETVDWLLDHPVTTQSHPSFPDLFAYDAEDAVLRAYRDCVEQLQALSPARAPHVHSYAHPKTADDGDARGR